MSALNDALQSIAGDQGILSGAADIIGAIKGTPQNVTYVQPPPPEPSGPPIALVIGGLVALVILFMVLKK